MGDTPLKQDYDIGMVRLEGERQEGFRQVLGRAAASGAPIQGLMTLPGYFDAYRSAWLSANLIQAQRTFSVLTPLSELMPKVNFTKKGKNNKDHEKKNPA